MPAAGSATLKDTAATAFWRARPWLCGAVAFMAWLAISIGLRPLNLPDEGRYVGVAWEMLRSGDWIVPTEDGLPFFHKPPLFYWMTAASMQVFGANAAAARLAPLLGAGLGGFALAWFARRRAGDAHAAWTLLVLATLPFFFGAAQFANLDMLVAGCIALTIIAGADAALAIRLGQPHRKPLCAAWAAAGLAVLAKGLIGLVLPGLVLLLWLLISGQRRAIVRLLSPLGLAVFALIAVPWFVAVQMRHPGFAHYFFVYQHFERFAGSGFNNVQPWWFFVATLPALALPWSLWLLRSSFRAAAGEPFETRASRQLMWTWLIAVLVFFSIPQSKPVGYLMPVLFPIAWLVAETAATAWRSGRPRLRRAVQISVGVAAAMCVCALVTSTLTDDRDNTVLGRTLLARRGADDPVVFVDRYFFDVPLHARLTLPVPVTGDWRDPKIAELDDWRRELAEAAPFAPKMAAQLLVDLEHGLGLRCGSRPLWVVARIDAVQPVAALPGAERILLSNRATLWRIPASACTPPATASLPP